MGTHSTRSRLSETFRFLPSCREGGAFVEVAVPLGCFRKVQTCVKASRVRQLEPEVLGAIRGGCGEAFHPMPTRSRLSFFLLIYRRIPQLYASIRERAIVRFNILGTYVFTELGIENG